MDNILDKVKKLLSLAKSDNVIESDLALQKATALAAEHDIDLAVAMLSPNERADTFEGKEDVIEFGKKKPTFQKYVTWILLNHFNIRIINSGGRFSGVKLTIVGDKPDVDTASYICSYLLTELERRWKYYKASTGVSVRDKQQWAYGVYQGLNTKLTETKKAQLNSRIADIPESIRPNFNNQYALVLSDKKKKVDEFVNCNHPDLRKGYTPSMNLSGNQSVRSDGFRAGYTMNISRPLEGQKCLN